MNKNTLQQEISEAHNDLIEAIEGLSPEQMRMVGVVGLWSVKDILAHLIAWQSEVVTALNQAQRKRVPSIMKIDDIDEWNDEQYHKNTRRPIEAIFNDLDSVHQMLHRMLDGFDQDSLFDNMQHSWMEGEPLAYLLEENVYLHEREHAAEIRAWRKEQNF